MNQNEYVARREAVALHRVFAGFRTVTLFAPDELERMQIGYGVDAQGRSLCGENAGDWKSSWLVIGDEDATGDPIFTDLSDDDLPIFTAMHGAGFWQPELIAESFANFIAALERLHLASQQHEVSGAADEIPMPQAAEITDFIAQ